MNQPISKRKRLTPTTPDKPKPALKPAQEPENPSAVTVDVEAVEVPEIREVWIQAVEEAGGKTPSGRIVQDVVDRIRDRTPVPNPYHVGEICVLQPKDNPDLRGKSGYWGMVTVGSLILEELEVIMSCTAWNLADKGTQAFSLIKESVFEAR